MWRSSIGDPVQLPGSPASVKIDRLLTPTNLMPDGQFGSVIGAAPGDDLI
jgi:hypothetical protein